MSWDQEMLARLPRLEDVAATPSYERPRRVEERAVVTPTEKPAKTTTVATERPTYGFGFAGMMLDVNSAYTDLVSGSKSPSKVDLPCGDCVESIAEQLMEA